MPAKERQGCNRREALDAHSSTNGGLGLTECRGCSDQGKVPMLDITSRELGMGAGS